MCFVCRLFFLHVCNCEIVYHAQDIDRSFLWLILLDYVRSLRMYMQDMNEVKFYSLPCYFVPLLLLFNKLQHRGCGKYESHNFYMRYLFSVQNRVDLHNTIA